MAACLDVMQGTLQRDPSKRPVMKSLLQARTSTLNPTKTKP
jgi:hypothetical protein